MAAKATVEKKSPVTFEDGWPVDEKGVPMVKISFATSNLVPTGNYANVTVGPAQATTFVPDTGNEEDLARSISDLANPVELALGFRRKQILDELEKA